MNTQIKETVRTQKSVTELKVNLKDTLKTINDTVEKNGWRLMIGQDEVAYKLRTQHFTFNKNMSMNSRKNVAKRLWRISENPSRRNINTFFYILHKLEIVSDKYNVKVSLKEEQIQAKRKVWVKLRDEAQIALEAYKAEKGDFYKQ